MSIVLSKIFARERPLIYFYLWNNSDREGCKTFTGQQIRHNLFIVLPNEHTGSVWYSGEELEAMEAEAEVRVNTDTELVDRMLAHARHEWAKLVPYAKAGKRIESGAEYLEFFKTFTSYWYPMNTVYFRLPERTTIGSYFKNLFYKWRDETQEYSGPLGEHFKNSFEELFPAFARFSLCVTPGDVQTIMNGDGEGLLPVLEDRLEHGCFLLDGELYPYSKLTEELKKRDLQLESFDTAVTEVKGNVGYKGMAQGPARIIRKFSDLVRVKDGDILIANLTEPSYMVAMQKVAAFVTDEGGIMSHAAIVAREMKKPCIIGTKFATQVFKDGDMVEVDAENGIVRKL